LLPEPYIWFALPALAQIFCLLHPKRLKHFHGKTVKKLAIAVLVTVAAAMIIALAAPFFVPADFVKSGLETLVKQRTGRDLQINGPLSLTFAPAGFYHRQ
jgi:hypothetical protein